MIEGTYKQKVDWKKYESPGAHDLFWSRAGQMPNYKTCGTGALSLLTGIKMQTVERQLPKSAEDWSDLAITQFLKKRHFGVIQLSKFGVTNLNPKSEWTNMPINSNHVLLCGLWMCRGEGSWWVIHNNFSYHNFQIEALNPLLLYNKPSMNTYLITHKSWK